MLADFVGLESGQATMGWLVLVLDVWGHSGTSDG